MKIKRNVEVPKRIGRGSALGEVSQAVLAFVESDDANICFECGGEEEARRVYSTVCTRIRNNNLPLRASKSMWDVYVLRKRTE